MVIDLIAPVTLTAIVSGIVILAEHYFPWRTLLGRKLPRVAAYALGMLAVLIPFTLLVLLKADDLTTCQIVVALWVIVFVAGIADAGCYALDHMLEYRSRAIDAEEREARFREEAGLSDVTT